MLSFNCTSVTKQDLLCIMFNVERSTLDAEKVWSIASIKHWRILLASVLRFYICVLMPHFMGRVCTFGRSILRDFGSFMAHDTLFSMTRMDDLGITIGGFRRLNFALLVYIFASSAIYNI